MTIVTKYYKLQGLLSGSSTTHISWVSTDKNSNHPTLTTSENSVVDSWLINSDTGDFDETVSFVVMGTTASLPNERTLTAGTGLDLTDGGAGSTATIGIDNNTVATISGSTFSGATLHSLGLSGSLTKLTDGTSYLIAGDNITITSASNGAVTIAGAAGGGSSTPSIFTFGACTTTKDTQVTDTTKLIVGSFYFNPNIIAGISGTSTVSYYYRASLETTSATYTASLDLYDYNGIILGTFGTVTSSILTTTSITSSFIEVDMTSDFTAITGSGMIQTRLWSDPVATADEIVTCSDVRLDVEFT